MKTRILAAALGCLCLIQSVSHAQVPQLINYQGRVVAAGTNFDGTGRFKFALVSADGAQTYWSNDGSSNNGSEPAAAVLLPVSKGLYSVLLGDSSLGNMTPIPNSVFNNPDVRLRVWFDDGSRGSQQLRPDQRIAAVGYAVMAANVPDGAITDSKIAAVNAAKVTGQLTATQLAPGAAATNLAAGGQSGVAPGGVILSAGDNPALVAAGYVRIGATQLAEAWLQRSSVGAPAPRRGHTVVWTGSEMIVWSGTGSSGRVNDGGRYNPVTNSWTPVSTTGAPSGRYDHTAVWTGSEMIVWGGVNVISSANTYFNDGGRYNPATDSWIPTNTSGAPSARDRHTAVWTGNEMIVWGGYGGSAFNTGARYNPADNSWTATTTTSAPAARFWHSAVWTGSEMIVWGGSGSTTFNDGARYNPASNSWTATSATSAPSARSVHTAVWTGSEMIVWGGGNSLTDGGRYNPANNTWTATTITGAPSGRNSHSAIWTGGEMIVFGGFNGAGLGDGTRYHPATNTWTAITTAGAPSARWDHTAIWTGSEMIVFGGTTNGPLVNDTFSYTPGKTMILYQKP